MSEPTTETGTNGSPPPAASPAAPEPTAKEKRALREQARREFKTAERERLEAEARKASAPSPEKGAAPAAQLDPGRTDAQRQADAAVFLSGVVMPLVSLFAWPFGYGLDLAAFTDAKAREDGAAWVPLARRYRWVDLLITWAGVPARLIARVRELKKPREKKPKEAAAP